MSSYNGYNTGRFDHRYEATDDPYYYDSYQTVDPSHTVYSARDEYPQQPQHVYGNWSSHSSESMARDASGTSHSSSSSYPYQSSRGTTPPVDFPDNQGYTQVKPKSRKSDSLEAVGNVLHCLHEQCEYKTKRQFDLDRHMNTHYPPPADQRLDCPGRGCGRVGEYGFKRKDHLTEHLRKVHAKPIPKGNSRPRGKR